MIHQDIASQHKKGLQTDRHSSLKQPLYSVVAEYSTGMFQGFASSDSIKTAEEVIILTPRPAQAANTQGITVISNKDTPNYFTLPLFVFEHDFFCMFNST